MQERFKYHFEPAKGWMNDPNGLIYYKGQYHAFFQHNPYAPMWDTMHWGHAVSEDMINWLECEIALYPDMPYENDGGCFSGSAIEKDGRLYLFYTSVSHELGQTQSVAYSDDGINFKKYEGNPVINHFPADGCKEFRDPKVIKYGEKYLMVVGSKGEKYGRVLLYSSIDLLDWRYEGLLYEADDYEDTIECPDLFSLGDKYVLMYSRIGYSTYATQFLIGSFDGRKFIKESSCNPEMGPQFYAPQTFEAPDGRRIMIGWFYDWRMKPDKGATYAGALSLPRELTIHNGKIHINPIKEAVKEEKKEDEHVSFSNKKLTVIDTISSENPPEYDGEIEAVRIYRDGKGIEIFINNGEAIISCWVK